MTLVIGNDELPNHGFVYRFEDKFVNSGVEWARPIDIHTSRRMTTEWLGDQEIG